MGRRVGADDPRAAPATDPIGYADWCDQDANRFKPVSRAWGNATAEPRRCAPEVGSAQHSGGVFVLNQKTAKALGLEFTLNVLSLADEVIE